MPAKPPHHAAVTRVELDFPVQGEFPWSEDPGWIVARCPEHGVLWGVCASVAEIGEVDFYCPVCAVPLIANGVPMDTLPHAGLGDAL